MVLDDSRRWVFENKLISYTNTTQRIANCRIRTEFQREIDKCCNFFVFSFPRQNKYENLWGMAKFQLFVCLSTLRLTWTCPNHSEQIRIERYHRFPSVSFSFFLHSEKSSVKDFSFVSRGRTIELISVVFWMEERAQDIFEISVPLKTEKGFGFCGKA